MTTNENNPMKQSADLEAYTRKTRASQLRLVLISLLICRESGSTFFSSQTQSVVIQNQSNCKITFDTQLKTALCTH